MNAERQSTSNSAEQLFRQGYQRLVRARSDANKTVAGARLRRALEPGHLRAANYSAATLERGNGLDQDLAEAARWYVVAAKGGIAAAQFNLGVFYAGGHGGAVDFGRAHYWLERALRLGHPDAERRKREIERVMTTEERAFSKHRLATFTDMTRIGL